MRALWAGLKLLVLALLVGLALAGAVLGAVGLLALWVARAGGLQQRGPLAALDAVLAAGTSHGPLVLAVLAGPAFGLAWSRAASERSSGRAR
ncbi:MAG: hypothetical protein ACLGI2_14430 [Acidimicrobiia bacterium]